MSQRRISTGDFAEFCKAAAYEQDLDDGAMTYLDFAHNFKPSFETAEQQDVNGISFQDAHQFASWHGYRLPRYEELLVATTVRWTPVALSEIDGAHLVLSKDEWAKSRVTLCCRAPEFCLTAEEKPAVAGGTWFVNCEERASFLDLVDRACQFDTVGFRVVRSRQTSNSSTT